MKEIKFYICQHCKNIVLKLHDAGVPVACCGEEMQELVAGVIEASAEKHIPAVETKGCNVNVKIGSVEHPMLEAHHIQWIYLETCCGGQIKWLAVDQKPEANFALAEGETVVAVYEYCNLHGLWKYTA